MLEHFDFIGAVLIVIAFALLTADVIGKYSYTYILPNFFGSIIMLIKAMEVDARGIAILQVFWAGCSGALLIIKWIYGYGRGDDLDNISGKDPR